MTERYDRNKGRRSFVCVDGKYLYKTRSIRDMNLKATKIHISINFYEREIIGVRFCKNINMCIVCMSGERG